jgi:hypothetical protein
LTEAKETLKTKSIEAKDFLRNMFVKIEPVSKWSYSVLEDYAPRAIMGMSDRLQVVLGPWSHAASKRTRSIFSVDSPILYAVGHTSEEIGRWFGEWLELFGGENVAQLLEADASRFDAHLQRPAFEARAEILKLMNAPKKYRQVYLQKIAKKGFSRHGIFFRRDGSRASGDSDTSWDNTMLNADFWLHMMNELGYRPGRHFAFAVAGDDFVMIMHPDIPILGVLKQIGVESLLSGQVWKLKPVVPLCNVTFLSALFLPTEDPSQPFVLVPKPGRILSRTGWSKQVRTNPRQHARGIALGLEKTASGVPILGALIESYIRLTEGVEAEAIGNHFSVRSSRKHVFGIAATVQLLDRYCLSLGSLHKLEKELRAIKSLPALLNSPIADRIVEVDLAG